jgi:gamma-glutamylaminecyclotransferase
MPATRCTDQHSTLLFVYGTLRIGGANHHLLEGALSHGQARTIDPYALYLGDYPYVAKSPPVSPIVGEVYAVDARILELVDDLEEHPDWYRREPVQVRLDNGGQLTAWLYFHPQPRGRCLESGDLFAA